MEYIQFQYPERIHFIWIIFGLVVLCSVLLWHRRGRLNQFMSLEMQSRLLTQASLGRRIAQLICFALAGIMCVIALMRPQIITESTVEKSRTSANIYVVLDVSKSMLATDVSPSRLERAKAEIKDMLPSFAADRVGLMAFAGRTTVLSPLTADHGFFKLVLDGAGPGSVTLGGTNLGEAIRKATTLLAPQEGPKAILLISDGEDHDSYPIEAAKEAKKNGIVIVTVGFGSERGTTIDVLDKKTGQKKRVVDSAGNTVISKLDGATLRSIAKETDGSYVPAATGVLDLDGIMRSVILLLVEDVNAQETKEMRVELYQWFVAFGLVFLAGFMLLEGSRRTRRNAGAKA